MQNEHGRDKATQGGLGEAFAALDRRDFLATALASGAAAVIPAGTVLAQSGPASKPAAAEAVASAQDAILRISRKSGSPSAIRPAKM